MKKLSYILLSAIILTGCSEEKQFDTTGTFESANEIIVSGEANGKIIALNLQEGDKVSSGQILGYIDTTQLHLTKLQLQKNSTSLQINKPDIEKQIAALQEQIKKQEFEQQRLLNLKKDGAASQKQIDDIASAIAVLKSQLNAQLSTLKKTTGSVDEQSRSIDIQIAQIDDRILKSLITAPVNGTVTAKFMNAGEFAAAGKPIYKVADLDNMYLRAYFTSAQIADMKIGQKVKVTADFGDEKEYAYDGTVIWIASDHEFTPKNIQTKESRADLVYAVKIAVKNDGRIKIGTYGEVSL